ncbi:4Fe-4S dicluster domain-containing protein [Rhizobium sp. KVB221]|uniref:4Fe-4S dicluster domain-containing protein n=1 Tax=Rhizobium setariae TaxID=2801340 RepID=A0A937CPZ7_9HYPH|nr:4Fe-4S dicluster domain-containing protein [Rhizobium setariae]MBL0373178.1 4Fe-4S dicluster domain-containing protein [Rhizobium setariae]
MGSDQDIIEDIRAGLSPHGIFLRGMIHFDDDGPELATGGTARTVILLGNIGGSIWPAFEAWFSTHLDVADPLDTWSQEVIRPTAEEIGATSWFPSEKPWQPFQQWAMRAEGLKPSPLGILVHPEYGLWHGYRGALGFGEKIGKVSQPQRIHPCDHCTAKPCLTYCPVDAIKPASFDVAACRLHLLSPAGRHGCLASGCLARNACPVGAEYRYPDEQLRFHMAALA